VTRDDLQRLIDVIVEELAAASRSKDVVSWNAANKGPRPTAAWAALAIWVELAGGRPTRRRTATSVSPTVNQITMATMAQTVNRANHTRARLSTCASCAMAD